MHLLYKYPMQMFLGFCHPLLRCKHWGGFYDVIRKPKEYQCVEVIVVGVGFYFLLVLSLPSYTKTN